MNNYSRFALSFASLLFCISSAFAVDSMPTNILFIIDCSERMNQSWSGSTYIKTVAAEMKNVLPKLTERADWGLNVGIRVFGDQNLVKKHDCADSRLAAAIEWIDPSTLSLVLDNLKPKGMPSLSKAILYCESDFKANFRVANNHIIVIAAGTDGCNEDEMASIKPLFERRAIDAIHYMGLNLSEKQANKMKDLAEKSKGQYRNAANSANLGEELLKVINEFIMLKTSPANATIP